MKLNNSKDSIVPRLFYYINNYILNVLLCSAIDFYFKLQLHLNSRKVLLMKE